MKEPDTDQEDMFQANDARKRSATLWWRMWSIFETRFRYVFPVSVAIIFLSLLLSWFHWRHPWVLVSLQYLPMLAGGFQILAGVFLNKRSADHLRALIKQEEEKPTRYLREVSQTRFAIDLLKQLRGYDPVAFPGPNGWAVFIDSIAPGFKTQLNSQASKTPTIKQLSQADVALALLSASTNTLFGTLLVILGTLISIRAAL